MVMLTISNKPSEIPECQMDSGYNYILDGLTGSGKMTLCVALAAYTRQKDVWLDGKNTFTLYPEMEDLKHIVAQ